MKKLCTIVLLSLLTTAGRADDLATSFKQAGCPGFRFLVPGSWGHLGSSLFLDFQPLTLDFQFLIPDRCSFSAGGWRIQFAKTSWVAFPFDFGMGGPLFHSENSHGTLRPA
jgi:hypothetical protein